MNFIYYEKIDSTNSEALRRLAEASDVRSLDKTVIAAGEQSAGRGRMKRAFYSPAQSGIYFTAIYAPLKKIDDPALLTACAAVAVCRSLKEFFGVEAKIKWVNDIYVRQKKVCGILAEGHLSKNGSVDAAAVGIGINIFPSAFPAEIASRAGAVLETGAAGLAKSAGNGAAILRGQNGERPQGQNSAPIAPGKSGEILQDQNAAAALSCQNKFRAPGFGGPDFRARENSASGQDDRREALARDVSQKLFDILEDGGKARAAMKEYAARSFIVGKRVAVVPVIGDQKSVYDATVLGIDGGARLLVRLDDGSERALSSGEISIKI